MPYKLKSIAQNLEGLTEAAFTGESAIMCATYQAFNNSLFQIKRDKKEKNMKIAFIKKKAPKGVGAPKMLYFIGVP